MIEYKGKYTEAKIFVTNNEETTTEVQNAIVDNLEATMQSKDYYSNDSLPPELRSRILSKK